MCGIISPITHPDVHPLDLPDIKLKITLKKGLKLGTFSDNMRPIDEIAEDAVHDFWDNFTMEEMQALDESDQTRLLTLFEILNIENSDSVQHLKLAYGLHLPQELVDLNTEYLKTLAARIIVDEDLYAGLACFLDKKKSENLELPYIEHEEDKRRLTNTFMQVMAEIWQIPDLVEEDYKQEPRIDKNGEEFLGFMHALYRSAANDNQPDKKVGLIYGANTYNGYLNGKRSHVVKSLSHEFGHLLSNFIVSAHADTALIESQKRKHEIRNATVLSLENTKRILSVNGTSSPKGRYYGATTTDFTEVSFNGNGHIYKGQLEERHADWMGENTLEYVHFALHNQDFINDFELIKQMLKEKTYNLMSRTSLYHQEPQVFKSIYAGIFHSRNFDELENAMTKTCKELDTWIHQDSNHIRKKRLANNVYVTLQASKQSIEHTKKTFTELKNFCDKVFDVRKITLDYGYDAQPAIQNALTRE